MTRAPIQRPPEPEPLIYAPGTRGDVGLMIMLSGPPGSGKTKSALMLATGLAGPGGVIGACDTEHGRMLYYAPMPGQKAKPPEDFDFLHLDLQEPFNPKKFEQAAVTSQKARHAVWICDSFSHEHVGPGGVLDMFEAELMRLAGTDFTRREQMKMVAWIEPKGQHKHMLQRLWQLNMHIILCCHADKKIEMIKDPETGKTKPTDVGYVPVCSPDIPYAMTISLALDPGRPGVPSWIKRFDKVAPLISLDKPLDIATGTRLAEWARGNRAAVSRLRERAPDEVAGRDAAPAPDAAPPAGGAAFPDANAPNPPPPDEGGPHSGEAAAPPAGGAPPPAGGAAPQTHAEPSPEAGESGAGRNEAIASGLIAAFAKVKVRAEHLAIVDDPLRQKQIAWLRKNKSNDLYPPLNEAIKASWARTASKEATAA
jgi:hypothetical protein